MEVLNDSEVESRDIMPGMEVPTIEEIEVRRGGISNMAQLGYLQIFYQKNNKILGTRLQCPQKKYNLTSFNLFKQTHEKGVKKFKQANSIEQNETFAKKRRRGYSIDADPLGAYYLNNWISSDDYPCEQKPPQQQKSALLIYQILNQQWTKALDLLQSFQKNPQISTLQFILRGFKSIQTIFSEQNQYFCEHFIHRHSYQICVKNSTESLGGPFNFVNIFEQNTVNKFNEIKSVPRKVQCLKTNLSFLVNFAGRYKVMCDDDYIKFAFILLGNQFDQQENNLPLKKDFGKILLQLDIKLSDRLNFATKLLTQKKRKIFCNELQSRLCHFSGLDNILFYLNAPQKIKQERIQQICKAYLDKYSDLETIGYLSHQFLFLKKYHYQYRQVLQFANQQKQIERLDYFKWGQDKQGLKEIIFSRKIKNIASYFDFLNIPQEKILELKVFREHFNICQICSKKMQKNQNFLQCAKCRHGGHTSHLLKWFQDSESCPHIGCPCLCN